MICRVGDRGLRVIGLTSFSFNPVFGASRHCFGEVCLTVTVFLIDLCRKASSFKSFHCKECIIISQSTCIISFG